MPYHISGRSELIYMISEASEAEVFTALYNAACSRRSPRQVKRMRQLAHNPDLFRPIEVKDAAGAMWKIRDCYWPYSYVSFRGAFLWIRMERPWWLYRQTGSDRNTFELEVSGYDGLYGKGAALNALSAYAEQRELPLL